MSAREPRVVVRWVAAICLGIAGLVSLGPSAQPPALGAQPTIAPFVSGRHVYDYAKVITATGARMIEKAAAKVEAESGSRVAVYTGAPGKVASIPSENDLMAAWKVTGLLFYSTSEHDLRTSLGSTLKARIPADDVRLLTESSFAMGMGNLRIESSILLDLAATDAILSNTHVMDALGILNPDNKQKVEKVATDLTTKDSTVYVAIVDGGDDPEKVAASLATDFTVSLHNSTAACFGVKGTTYGGTFESGFSILDYATSDPWAKNGVLSNRSAPNGDVQAGIVAAVNAIHSSSLQADIIGAVVPVLILIVVIFAVILVVTRILFKRLGGSAIKGGLPGSAIIQTIADTGMTMSSSSIGPEAPRYKFGLLVTPASGGAAYPVETTAFVPRVYVPMVVPGAQVGVQIDPRNPQKVAIDFKQLGGFGGAMTGFGGQMAGYGAAPVAGYGAAPMTGYAGAPMGYGSAPMAGYGAAPVAGMPVGQVVGPDGKIGMEFAFDANGQPLAGQVSNVVTAVASGQMRTIRGSAAELLATGTHGTAVITTASPLGKKVRDINPNADPARLDDPMWLFTVEVSVAGTPPFPAVFGHRVPVDKVAYLGPGVKLAVAVDMTNRNNEVAIDWDKSPVS